MPPRRSRPSPNEFVVANDETNVLFSYRLGEPKAIGSLDLTQFLGVGRNQEADIEGAAAIGSRIYWITSHSRNSKGQARSSRYRLFATELRDDAANPVVPVGKPYKHLLHDLTECGVSSRAITWRRFQTRGRSGRRPQHRRARGDARWTTADRLPQPASGRARPRGSVGESGRSRRRQACEAGRSVRTQPRPSRHPQHRAGGRTISDRGRADGRRRQLRAVSLVRQARRSRQSRSTVDLGSLRPEALFAIPETAKVQLLSDDGGVVNAGVECKKLPAAKQTFRSLVVTP